MVAKRAAVLVVLVAACSEKTDAPPPAPAPLTPPADASSVDGITTITGYDPASGMHLDDDNPNRTQPKRPMRNGTPIGILLKSTPSGAAAFVDGEYVGDTPHYWSGIADGSTHEFAFAKANYALARFSIVPISSGTLHPTLERVGEAPGDGGLGPYAPHTDAAVAPPSTILTPADATRIATPPGDATQGSGSSTTPADAGDPMPPETPGGPQP